MMLEYNEIGKEIYHCLENDLEMPESTRTVYDSLVYFDDFYYEIFDGAPDRMIENMAKVFTPESIKLFEDALNNSVIQEMENKFSAIAPEC